MNRLLRIAVIPALLATPLLAGCTSLQSVSLTQIPGDRSRPVRAVTTDTALLGIHFDNDFVGPLTAELMAQCPRGRVTGILTKQESTLYVVVQTRRVIARGYCVYDAPVAVASPPPIAPPPPSAAPPQVAPPPPPREDDDDDTPTAMEGR